ncbi:MAG TPA: histidine phosphatase family protein [Sphingobium sp.]|nr:histidine phosphatase family protein [Sphingobium sp.]
MTSFALHLMRHGAPEMAGRLLGHLDAPPLDEGMTLCIDRARGLDFAQVITSDLARARAPGALIAAERDLRHSVDPRWRELNFGAWEGADPAVLPADDLARFWDSPDDCPPPGGERWSELCARVGTALSGLSEPALVLSHAGAMRAALVCLCGFGHRQGWAIDLPYGAVVSLRVRPGDEPLAQITGLAT